MHKITGKQERVPPFTVNYFAQKKKKTKIQWHKKINIFKIIFIIFDRVIIIIIIITFIITVLHGSKTFEIFYLRKVVDKPLDVKSPADVPSLRMRRDITRQT